MLNDTERLALIQEILGAPEGRFEAERRARALGHTRKGAFVAWAWREEKLVLVSLLSMSPEERARPDLVDHLAEQLKVQASRILLAFKKAPWWSVPLGDVVDPRLRESNRRPIAGAWAYYRHRPEVRVGMVLGLMPTEKGGSPYVVVGDPSPHRAPRGRIWFGTVGGDRMENMTYTREALPGEYPWHGIPPDLVWLNLKGRRRVVLPDGPETTTKGKTRLKYRDLNKERGVWIRAREFWRTHRPEASRKLRVVE